jgi:predicted peroxiredoxin
MVKLLYLGFSGPEDPIRASFPFLAAVAEKELAGHHADIFLIGDAVLVMKDAVAKTILPLNWPTLSELMAKTIESGIPIYI